MADEEERSRDVPAQTPRTATMDAVNDPARMRQAAPPAPEATRTETVTQTKSETDTPPPPIKVSFNLPAEMFEELAAFADKRGVTKTQAIRDALSLQKYVGEVIDGNGRLLIQRGDDERLREVVFW